MATAPIEDRLLELLVKWDEFHRQGRDVTPEELCSECPELVEELRSRIDIFRKMGSVLATGPNGLLSTPGEANSDGAVGARYPTPCTPWRLTGLNDITRKVAWERCSPHSRRS